MIKKLISLVALVVAVSAVNVGVVSAQAVQDNKVTICHGTNSVVNPYTRPTVDADAADGDTGNDNGKGDHSTHTGPVATSPQVAQDLKNSKTAWGDIIPPHHNFPGLNWTAEGQEIWNNGCNYGEVNLEYPFVTFEVTCPTTVGGKVLVTLTNEGYADGTATVNGEVVEVAAETTVVLEFDLGQAIEVVIERQTVYDETPVCVGGRGADEPVTPASTTTPQVEAPKAGVAAGGANTAIIALLIASAFSVAYGVVRALRFRKLSA